MGFALLWDQKLPSNQNEGMYLKLLDKPTNTGIPGKDEVCFTIPGMEGSFMKWTDMHHVHSEINPLDSSAAQHGFGWLTSGMNLAARFVGGRRGRSFQQYSAWREDSWKPFSSWIFGQQFHCASKAFVSKGSAKRTFNTEQNPTADERGCGESVVTVNKSGSSLQQSHCIKAVIARRGQAAVLHPLPLQQTMAHV